MAAVSTKKQHAISETQEEINVETDWSNLLGTSPSALSYTRHGDMEVWLMDSLLTTDECEALIECAEEHGFGTTHYPKHYRGNLRLQTTDQKLANSLWERIRDLVPPTVTCEDETWDACGLNECWRLAKYYPGDVFGTHCDAHFVRSSSEMSMFTLNIYLNGGFEGGATRFYETRGMPPNLSVDPQAGKCLMFRQPPGQQYLHDGEELKSGIKYLLRSDVMYRRRDA